MRAGGYPSAPFILRGMRSSQYLYSGKLLRHSGRLTRVRFVAADHLVAVAEEDDARYIRGAAAVVWDDFEPFADLQFQRTVALDDSDFFRKVDDRQLVVSDDGAVTLNPRISMSALAWSLLLESAARKVSSTVCVPSIQLGSSGHRQAAPFRRSRRRFHPGSRRGSALYAPSDS